MPRLVGEGILRGCEALEPTASATSVRVREGRTMLRDGPHAETREQLGGFYIVERDSLDQAADAARRIPEAVRGVVEVRPIMEFADGARYGTQVSPDGVIASSCVQPRGVWDAR